MKKEYEVPNVELVELNIENGIAMSQADVVYIDDFNDLEEW